MIEDAGTRLLVARQDLSRLRVAPDPDAPAARPLADGQVRLAVAHFALTANNVTYAAFGDAMKYWQFFPTGDAAWGCIPVWGFATVVESRADGVAVGTRVYGYLPMGTHLVVQPARADGRGFVDAAGHRSDLAAVYNHYLFCAADPGHDAAREAQQALLRPLFVTSFLIDDLLAEQGDYGAGQLLLSSASSKTAYGTAFCVSRRAQRPAVVGLTSAGNVGFSQGLGCYDEVLDYGALATLDPAQCSVFIDFAGNAALRRRVHEHFGGALAYSMSVGGTHWDALGGGAGLTGPRPVLFFAPAQIKRRSLPPPDGWGAAVLRQRIDEAWRAFMVQVDDPVSPWLQVQRLHGAAAVEGAYRQLLRGGSDPRHGLMLSL